MPYFLPCRRLSPLIGSLLLGLVSLPRVVSARPPIAPPALPAPPINPWKPTSEQIPVLYVSIIFLVFDIAVWHLPGVKVLANPFKLLTIGWHEMCHMVVALLSGGQILRQVPFCSAITHGCVTIDPNLGGCTRVAGGSPTAILAAGYLGSTIFGAALVIGAFDIVAAKILSFVIALALLAPVTLVRDRLTLILIAIYEALLIGFWFIEHGIQPLRWLCLFVGILNLFYAVWDFIDDRYFKKTNDSDASQYSLLFPKTKPHHWALGWIIFEIIIFVGFILIGITCLKRTSEQMYAEAATFLPT